MPRFHTETPLARAFTELVRELAARLGPSRQIDIFVAGGMAVHLYTGSRATGDVDAEFSARFHMPTDLVISYVSEAGTEETVYFDTNYNPMFALLHEDYIQDSIPVDLDYSGLRVRALAPVDLAVSKISRFLDHDQQDIYELVRLGLTSAQEIEARATSALAGHIGDLSTIKANIKCATAIARDAEKEGGAKAKPPKFG